MNNKSASVRLSLVFLLALIVSACTNYSDPEAVAQAYVKAVYNNKVEDFKKLIEKKDYDGSQDYELFVQQKSTGRLLTQLARGGINEIIVTGSNVSGPKAYIKITVNFANKESKNLNINLHQNDDRWYVDAMSWGTW